MGVACPPPAPHAPRTWGRQAADKTGTPVRRLRLEAVHGDASDAEEETESDDSSDGEEATERVQRETADPLPVAPGEWQGTGTGTGSA